LIPRLEISDHFSQKEVRVKAAATTAAAEEKEYGDEEEEEEEEQEEEHEAGDVEDEADR
jgi:hypothetical protein